MVGGDVMGNPSLLTINKLYIKFKQPEAHHGRLFLTLRVIRPYLCEPDSHNFVVVQEQVLGKHTGPLPRLPWDPSILLVSRQAQTPLSSSCFVIPIPPRILRKKGEKREKLTKMLLFYKALGIL